MRTSTSPLLALILLVTASTLHADPLKSINDPRMDWFKDAKFGLMIHWGMYAMPAGYWSNDKTFESWRHADESGLEQISGEYSVSILYAAHPNLAKDKKNDIQIDGKTLLGFATRATKGASQDPWRNFEAHEIGRISIETGRRTLTIVPQPNQNGRNLTIKHISLTKVD